MGGWNDYGGLFERSRIACTLDDAPLMNFLGPVKLYKRSLLVEHGIRFPLGVRAEDHPFAIECYFAAHNICVFADRDYYHYRMRDDGVSVSMGTLNENLAYVEERLAGCRNHFAALDAHTCVHERPGLYERGLRTCAKVLRGMSDRELDPNVVQRYRELVLAYYTDQARGFLSLSNMLLLDALVGAQDAHAAVSAVRNLSRSGASLELRCGGYLLRDAAGEALFEGTFPAEAHIGPKLAKPELSLVHVGAAALRADGELEFDGTAFVFQAGAPEGGRAVLRVRNKATSESVDFACDAHIANDEIAYGSVRYWRVEWHGSIDLRRCAPLSNDPVTSLLDIFFAYEGESGPIREFRFGLGKFSDPHVGKAFANMRFCSEEFCYAMLINGKGKFSVRLFSASRLLEALKVMPAESARWDASTLVVEGRCRWPLDELEAVQLRLVDIESHDVIAAAAPEFTRDGQGGGAFLAYRATLPLKTRRLSRLHTCSLAFEFHLDAGRAQREVPARLLSEACEAFTCGSDKLRVARALPRTDAKGRMYLDIEERPRRQPLKRAKRGLKRLLNAGANGQ